jgi:hypothetical protein
MSCNKKLNALDLCWTQHARCPEHGGLPPYGGFTFHGDRVDAVRAVDAMAFGCLDDVCFDDIGYVLTRALEAWVAEADRRANIENKEQET